MAIIDIPLLYLLSIKLRFFMHFEWIIMNMIFLRNAIDYFLRKKSIIFMCYVILNSVVKKKILLIILILFVINSYSQCPSGDVILSTQSDVEALLASYPNCTNLEGNLILEDSVSDLSDLSNLESIGGDLTITQTQLTHIVFDSLTSLGGNLSIIENENLQGVWFHNLVEFSGNLWIYLNTVIEEIHGFDQTVELEALGIYSQPLLTTIPEFNSLVTISEGLSINDNSALTGFSGFISLSCIGALSIHDNASLTSIPEFNNLTYIDTTTGLNALFRISSNPLLTHISGFEQLEHVPLLTISSNGIGEDTVIPSFNALKEATYIYIFDIEVEALNGFENLISVLDIQIENSQMRTISGFNNLISVRNLEFKNNENLESINGFDKLKRISGTFRLFNNSTNTQNIALTLNAFNILETISRSLIVSSNPKLYNLNFLSRVMRVASSFSWEMTIIDNPNLSDCSGISNLFNYGEMLGNLTIANNASNCDTVENIIVSGDHDNDGILDSMDLDDDNDGILDTIEQNGDPNLDTDGDLLPDHLDINSDNDGCYDVIEAGFNDDDDNGILGTFPETVDTNGLIIGAPSGYTTPLDANGDSAYDFQDIGLSPTLDAPIFTIVDANIGDDVTITTTISNADMFQWQLSTDQGDSWMDLNNDTFYTGVNTPTLNILNVDTSFSNYWYRLQFNNQQSTCTLPLYINPIEVNVYDEMPYAGSNSSIVLCNNDAAIDLFNYLGSNITQGGHWYPELTSGTSIFDPAVDSPGVYIYSVNDGRCFTSSAMVVIVLEEVPNAGEDTTLSVCSTSNPLDIFALITGDPETGGVWTPALSSGANLFDPAIDTAGTYSYTVSNECGTTNSSEIIIEINDDLPFAGNDTSLTLCADEAVINLLDVIEGTPDAGGVLSPSLQGGSLIFDPAIDNGGTYTYTVDNGGDCGTDTATVIINVINTPNAGMDSDVTLCETEGPVDVLGLMQGTPQSDGVWTPAFASGTHIFDPSLDQADSYTYTVTNACGTDSAIVAISIGSGGDSGISNTITICDNDAPIDLWEVLDGTPDPLGTWTPALNSGTGLFDPQMDASGVYVYTVYNQYCGEVSSQVTIDVLSPPNIGVDTTIELCVRAAPINLLELLDEHADTEGTWSPSLASGTHIFDPSVDTAGTYVYIIHNACGTYSSSIAITITDTYVIDDFEIITTELSASNRIEILVNTAGNYEYTLDGSSYQNTAVFTDLPGGVYTIGAREINGCRFFTTTVSLIDYPLFFTPNGDGRHDVWRLTGIEDQGYKIQIFDRYGKLLQILGPSNPSWDGRLNGQALPSTDYWFLLTLDTGRTLRGHFSLKR